MIPEETLILNPQWFRDATAEQLAELLSLIDCLPEHMVHTYLAWAQEKTQWYQGVDCALVIARSWAARTDGTAA